MNFVSIRGNSKRYSNPIHSTLQCTCAQWAGRSIALGTFPVAEAKRKAEEAKKLTKLWRKTKKPRPSHEWVVDELERLSVRVISVRRRSTGEMNGEKSQPVKQSGSTADVYAKQHTVAEKEIRRVSYADSDISDVSGDDEEDGPSAKRARTQDAIDVSDVATSMARRSSLNLIASILNDTDFDREITIPDFDVLFGEGPTCSINNTGADTASAAITRSDTCTSRPTSTSTFNLLPTIENDPSDEKKDQNRTIMGDLYSRSSTLLMSSGPTTGTACTVAVHASFQDMSQYKILQIHHVNLVEELEKTTSLLYLYQQQIISNLKKE